MPEVMLARAVVAPGEVVVALRGDAVRELGALLAFGLGRPLVVRARKLSTSFDDTTVICG